MPYSFLQWLVVVAALAGAAAYIGWCLCQLSRAKTQCDGCALRKICQKRQKSGE